jgi:hypothetical protein
MAGIPQKPIITGYKSSLREKETTTLNCQSSGSKPAAQLTWRKGDQELHGEYLLSQGCRKWWYWEGGWEINVHIRHGIEEENELHILYIHSYVLSPTFSMWAHIHFTIF